MIDIIEYNGKEYPHFQAEGFAAQFVIPFAKFVCKGVGYDIGCMHKEWAFPGAIAIDTAFNDGFDAYHLPQKNVDYIFSSHCLEHLPQWVDALDYWTETLKEGGVLFLYLPHYAQEYWRPWNNRKHMHALRRDVIIDYMRNKYTKIFSTERDLNDSFCVMGEKKAEFV